VVGLLGVKVADVAAAAPFPAVVAASVVEGTRVRINIASKLISLFFSRTIYERKNGKEIGI